MWTTFSSDHSIINCDCSADIFPMIHTSWNMPTDVHWKQWLLLWKIWIASPNSFFFFWLGMLKRKFTEDPEPSHDDSIVMLPTWPQLHVLPQTIWCARFLHYEQVCCFLFYRVFHYFTILWDGLFWNINDITNIPLSGAVFINCICLSYWWYTLVCKYIISIYCYTIYFTENKFICFKIWLFLLVLHHQKPFDSLAYCHLPLVNYFPEIQCTFQRLRVLLSHW